MPLVVVLLFAWMLVIAFLAFIACTFEDLESDTGSQSNPNSQVQLAAQVGQVHRFFNKAISGEPLSNAMYCTVAGTTAWVLLQKLEPIVPDAKWKAAVVAIPLGVAVAAMIHIIFSTTAHCGRTAGQKRFEQPIYLDVLYGHLLPIATHGFMTTFCITSIAYIQSNIGYLAGGGLNHPLNHPFALPLLGFVWGITVGAIGSSTGDVHYGTEREFQDRPFGEGKRVVYHGKITRYADCGIRTQRDIVGFCAKFGGPCTGLTFGLIILFENYRTLIGMRLGGFLSALPAITTPEEMFIPQGDMAAIWGIVVGLLIVAVFIVGNMVFVKWMRKKCGPFVGV